jgi:hypothetical protein
MKKEAPRRQTTARLTEQKKTFAICSAVALCQDALLCRPTNPLLDFCKNPNLATFRVAFPHLVGRDLALSDFLEFNRSLPSPKDLSGWISRIHDALHDDFVPLMEQTSKIGAGTKSTKERR